MTAPQDLDGLVAGLRQQHDYTCSAVEPPYRACDCHAGALCQSAASVLTALRLRLAEVERDNDSLCLELAWLKKNATDAAIQAAAPGWDIYALSRLDALGEILSDRYTELVEKHYARLSALPKEPT